MATRAMATQPDSINYVAEIGDFLFATDTIAKIAKGQGTWGDAALVGVTAASFFVAPAKIMQLSSKALNAVIKGTTRVLESDVTSTAAKNAASRTLNDALTMKRQGYVPTGDETVERVGRAGMPESKPSPTVPDRTTPTPAAIAEKGLVKKEYAGSGQRYESTPESKDLTTRRQPGPDNKQPFAADQPDNLTSELVDQIDKLYKFRKNMSDASFNVQRARILVQLFPEQALLPDVANVSRTADELITSSGNITNAKKKEIIRNLKASDNPDDVRLAKELEDLDLKTLKQEVDVKPGKKKGSRQVVTTREVPSDTTGARSAIQPELDDVLYQKELAENMLREASSPTGPVDPGTIQRLTAEIKKLDDRAVKLQGAIDDPYSTYAMDQTKKIIPNRRPGRESTEYVSPRSYRARESVKRSGKAPDSPARSTLSELKSDEETILKQLKGAEPGQRKALEADLKRTRKEIMNVQVGRLRQSLDDQVKNIPAASKSVDDLTLRELESEIVRLRGVYKKVSKLEGKQAEEILEEIAARGKAVRELLDKAKTRSGKPASDIADIKGKGK